MRDGTVLPSMHRGTCPPAWPFLPWGTCSNRRWGRFWSGLTELLLKSVPITHRAIASTAASSGQICVTRSPPCAQRDHFPSEEPLHESLDRRGLPSWLPGRLLNYAATFPASRSHCTGVGFSSGLGPDCSGSRP